MTGAPPPRRRRRPSRWRLALLGVGAVLAAMVASAAVTLLLTKPEPVAEQAPAPVADPNARAEAALDEARRLAAAGRAEAALALVRATIEELQPQVTDAWTLLDLKTLRTELAGARDIERFSDRATEARRSFDAGRLGVAYAEARSLERFGSLFLQGPQGGAERHPEVVAALADLRTLRETIEARMRAEADRGRYLVGDAWAPLAEYVPWRLEHLGSIRVRFAGRMSQVLHDRMYQVLSDLLGAKSEAAANAVYYEDALPWRGIPLSMDDGLMELVVTYRLGREIDRPPPGGPAVAWATFELRDPIVGATLYYGWGIARAADLRPGTDTDAEALNEMVRDGVRRLVAGTRTSVVEAWDATWFAMLQAGDDPAARERREIALFLQERPEPLPEIPEIGRTKAFAFARLRLVNERGPLTLRASGAEVGTYEVEARAVTTVDLAPGDYHLLWQDEDDRLYAIAQTFAPGGTYEAVLYRAKSPEDEERLRLKPARLTADYQEVVWEEGFPAFANLTRDEATRRLLRIARGDGDPDERIRALQTAHRLLRQSPRDHEALGALPRIAADRGAPAPVRALAVAILCEYRYNDFQKAWVAAHYRDFDRRLDEIIKAILVDPEADPALKTEVKRILEAAAGL